MATPSVLTVPSMYGDGILYSGPTVFSNEIVVNGNFETDSDWNKTSGVTISNNKATINVTGGGFESLTQPTTYDIGEKYIVKLTIQGLPGSSGNQIRFQDDAGNLGTLFQIETLNELEQNFQVEWIPNAQSDIIRIARSTTSGDYSFTVIRVSIKKITQGSDFEFTRSTTGTRINEEGYIEDVPYNIIPYSQDIDNADWDKVGATVSANEIIAPNNSLTGDKINETGAGTYHNVNHDDKVENGITYTASAYFKAAERTTASIYENFSLGSLQLSSFNLITGEVDFQNANHIAKISSAGSGWYRCSITFTPNARRTGSLYYAPNNQLTYSGVLNSGVFMWGAQFVKGDKTKNYLPTTDRLNLPRLNYPVYGGCPSLLVEPQSTNLVTYSNDYTQSSWVKQNFTANSETTTAPDGLSISGYDFGDGFLYMDLATMVNGASYTNSVYIKANKNGTIGFRNGGSGSSTSNTNINLTTSWQRFTATSTASGGVTGRFLLDNRASTGYGVSDLKVFIYGAQNEQLSYATSLIPTSGSTVTRNEDKAINSGLGTTDTFNDDEGVLFIETEALVNNTEARGISINAGNGQNRVLITYPNTGSSRITGFIQTNAGGGLNANIDGIDTTQKHKVALKYKLNDCAVFIDGVKRIQANSVAMPVGLDRLHFSNGVTANSAEYRGNLNAIAVYKTALTDTELANLTSYNNHDLFIPYRSRMQMIGADQELQCTEHDITRFL